MTEPAQHIPTAGNGLTPEQLAEIREAEKRPIVFDEDCPELTDEQLAEFKPVNFETWEERARRMKAAGITDPEQVPALKMVLNT
jgi:hypothetical protein